MEKKGNYEIVFFGKITAGITHEMNNVLAIIKESAGLMDDLMSLSGEARFPHKEKFENALSRINAQVDRGTNLSRILNTFAHGPDKDIATVDLHELSGQVIALCQRFARLQHVNLIHDPSDQPLRVVTRPVQLQMAIFTTIQCCLDVLESGDAVQVGGLKTGAESGIQVICKSGHPPDTGSRAPIDSSENWTRVQQIVLELQGSATLDEAKNRIFICLPNDISRV